MEGQHIQENVPMSVPLEHEGAGGTYRLLYGPNFNCLKYSSRIIMYFKYIRVIDGLGWFMVFNATFNNISVISWRSVLLVDETGVPGENNRPVASH